MGRDFKVLASLRQTGGGSSLYLHVIVHQPSDKLCFGTSDLKMALSNYMLKLGVLVCRVLRSGCHFDSFDGLVGSRRREVRLARPYGVCGSYRTGNSKGCVMNRLRHECKAGQVLCARWC